MSTLAESFARLTLVYGFRNKIVFSSAVDCQAAEIFGFRCFVQIQASRCRRISDIDKCSYQGFENRNVNKTMMKTFQDDNMMSATFPIKDAPA